MYAYVDGTKDYLDYNAFCTMSTFTITTVDCIFIFKV